MFELLFSLGESLYNSAAMIQTAHGNRPADEIAAGLGDALYHAALAYVAAIAAFDASNPKHDLKMLHSAMDMVEAIVPPSNMTAFEQGMWWAGKCGKLDASQGF